MCMHVCLCVCTCMCVHACVRACACMCVISELMESIDLCFLSYHFSPFPFPLQWILLICLRLFEVYSQVLDALFTFTVLFFLLLTYFCRHHCFLFMFTKQFFCNVVESVFTIMRFSRLLCPVAQPQEWPFMDHGKWTPRSLAHCLFSWDSSPHVQLCSSLEVWLVFLCIAVTTFYRWGNWQTRMIWHSLKLWELLGDHRQQSQTANPKDATLTYQLNSHI